MGRLEAELVGMALTPAATSCPALGLQVVGNDACDWCCINLHSCGSLQICISFNETEATVKLPDAEFQFPNRLGMEKIEYLAVEGDFKVKAIKFSDQL